jgi:hypothetical protein
MVAVSKVLKAGETRDELSALVIGHVFNDLSRDLHSGM